MVGKGSRQMEILPGPIVGYFSRANCQFTGRVIVSWNMFHCGSLPNTSLNGFFFFDSSLNLHLFQTTHILGGKYGRISHTSPTSCDLFGTVMQWCFRGLYSAWRMANATWKHRMPWDDWDMAWPGKGNCMGSERMKQCIEFPLDFCGWENGSKSVISLHYLFKGGVPVCWTAHGKWDDHPGSPPTSGMPW